jgi:uncharacterized protein (DUF488 family)
MVRGVPKRRTGIGMPKSPDRDVAVVTVGHGARRADALLAVLRDAGVEVLVDVRRYPGSRRHPQFGRDALAGFLAEAGIEYEWWGETLGGRRRRSPDSRHTALREPAFVGYADHMDTAAFRTAVEALLDLPGRPAIMCAETVWWHCHRMLISDALTMRGATVTHLLDVGRRQPHHLHQTVRRGDDGWPVYDVSDVLPGL